MVVNASDPVTAHKWPKPIGTGYEKLNAPHQVDRLAMLLTVRTAHCAAAHSAAHFYEDN